MFVSTQEKDAKKSEINPNVKRLLGEQEKMFSARIKAVISNGLNLFLSVRSRDLIDIRV